MTADESLDIKVAKLEAREDSLAVRVARHDERIAAAATALDLAKTQIDKKLVEMNEMRAQISAERNVYLPKTEFQVSQERLRESLAHLYRFMYILTGGLLLLHAIGGAVVSFVISRM